MSSQLEDSSSLFEQAKQLGTVRQAKVSDLLKAEQLGTSGQGHWHEVGSDEDSQVNNS